MLSNVSLRFLPLNGVVANWNRRLPISHGSHTATREETRSRNTHDHLVQKDTERPPVDGRGVAISVHDLWGYVLCTGVSMHACTDRTNRRGRAQCKLAHLRCPRKTVRGRLRYRTSCRSTVPVKQKRSRSPM